MRHYVYLSDAKIDMLYQQVSTSTRTTGGEIGIGLKIFKASRKLDGAPDLPVYDKLASVEEWIYRHEPVGTIAHIAQDSTHYGTGAERPWACGRRDLPRAGGSCVGVVVRRLDGDRPAPSTCAEAGATARYHRSMIDWFNTLDPNRVGPLSGWTAAVIAVVALLFAATSSVLTRRTIRNQTAALTIQRKQFEIFEQDRISDQARRVTLFEEKADGALSYLLRNDSDWPILLIRLTGEPLKGGVDLMVPRVAIIAPNSQHRFSFDRPERLDKIANGPDPSVIFTDSFGQIWVRGRSGNLRTMEIYRTENAYRQTAKR